MKAVWLFQDLDMPCKTCVTFLWCVSIHPGGTSDLIGGFADFSSPAASASLPTSTGKHGLAYLFSSKHEMLSIL